MAAISLPTPRDIQSVVEEEISLAGGKAAKAIGGWNCFTPGHIILAARQTRTLGNLG